MGCGPYMKVLLEMWIQRDYNLKREELDRLWKGRMDRLMQSLKQRQPEVNSKVVKLRSCSLLGRSAQRLGSVNNVRKFIGLENAGQDLQIRISYEEELVQGETEKWFLLDLSPSRVDLDELETNPHHTFQLIRKEPYEALSLDVSTKKLLKLAFLKTGQFLAFILSSTRQTQVFHVSLITLSGTEHVVKSMNHGFDLIAFDGQSRFLAQYDRSTGMIKTYRFEEGYRRLEFSGAELCLKDLGDIEVKWMKLVPGRAEVVFVDSDNTVRVFKMVAPGMVRSKEIKLPGPPERVEVTRQGPCLLVFNNVQEATTSNSTLKMEVFWIDQSMSHVSSINLYSFNTGPSFDVQFNVAVRGFGPQEQLFLHVENQPRVIQTYVLKITLASEGYQLSRESSSKLIQPQQSSSGLALDYIYHVYEKFSTNPPIAKQSRALSCYVVLRDESEVKEECLKYLESCFTRLKTEKGKNFHGLDRHLFAREVSEVSTVLTEIANSSQPNRKRGYRRRAMGDWVRQLLCLVPIQIARAENNALIPLVDGLELSSDVDYSNTISLASLLRFGFYDAVFASWRDKPLKIISSMGKQSSGKSYLLNHSSGSLLDVSGGRCTDGVWMTVRTSEEDAIGCMYVLLDFEGVGTFERSEQEDMLLSVFNAAISNITIYNKKDSNLDRETETVFARFQNGVQLVKEDEKLFSGMFYMALKDVGENDVEELDIELWKKIDRMVANNKENFLTKMYDGRVQLGFMASFDTPHYYTSIDEIFDTISDPDLEFTYTDGRSFATDLKLLISQLCAKDWASMDSKRMELRVHLMHAHLDSAISLGRLDTKGNEVNLANFDSQVEVEDSSIQMDDHEFQILDTGLKLKIFNADDSVDDILLQAKGFYQRTVERTGENDERWHSGFIDFLERLADRRKTRVLQWISCNTVKFDGHEEIERIKLQASAICTELKQKLSVCSVSCKKCFLRCTKVKGHSEEHSCLGNHTCSQRCTYCITENNEQTSSAVAINKCADVAGHQGSHDCRSRSHTCQEKCIHDGLAGNCNKICAGTVGHFGVHLCNSIEHKCPEKCSLGSCTNPCVTPFAIRDHAPHACHEKFCPMPCRMRGCNRICANKDHFHDNDPSAEHYCGLPHACLELCETRGNCAVQQDLVRTTKTYISKYGSFEYEHVAEQSGIRKPCCKEIPPFKTTHEGPHSHTLNDKVVHLCDTKCPACGCFCTDPFGHGGHHNTVHGNMRDTKFTSESEKIDMGDRVYAWGESGAAEMCNMYCKKQGRGHVHLVLCPTSRKTGVCYGNQHPDGVRHQTEEYGPDFDVAKDEMTHAAYWRHIRFLDPCTAEDQALFSLCGHVCQSSDHQQRTSKGKGKLSSEKSCCTQQVWHAPITDSEEDRRRFTQGYVTRDGHHMNCRHEKPANIVFVIDRSYSTSEADVTPQYVQLQESHNNRLGCVYEAILRFVKTRAGLQLGVLSDAASVVLYNHSDTAITPVELDVMDEGIISKLLPHSAQGGTAFSSGLKQAERILLQAKDQGDNRPPVVVFLSDGANYGPDDELAIATVTSMRSNLDGLQIFTIKFGSDKEQIFDRIADKGKAYVNLDRLMLSNTFVQITKSLKPRTYALTYGS